MTPPDNDQNAPRLTLREMLELATLDVFGVLDEQERRVFDATFLVLPPAQQDQVRAQQALSARCTHLLPDVEPRPELRQAALERVQAEDQADRTVVARLGTITTPGPSGISRLWRSAAIGAVAASLLLGFMLVLLNREFSNLQQAARLAASDQHFASTLVSNWAFVLSKPGSKHLALTATDMTPQRITNRAQGFFLFDPISSKTLFRATALPFPGAEYAVYLVEDAAGLSRSAEPVHKFIQRITAVHDRIFQVLDIAPSAGVGRTYQIVAYVPGTQERYQVLEAVF
ncbi:MAG: hypothetical protein C0475_08620 [Planctomyces sp.]|nr:hypothetical protein [Planctomyces sp.]MBA4039123.1 hypothetical protein [Planctomyces sp.]